MTLVKIRKIKKEEMKEALELVWEVFLANRRIPTVLK